MEKVSACLICGGNNLKKYNTKVSDFVSIRTSIAPSRSTRLCYCKDCSFGFYEDRLNDEENALLYAGYRGPEYQAIREKCEPWYTKALNDGLNNDITGLSEQKRVIEAIIQKNITKELKVALDYGGNEGRTFTDLIGTKEKYVFDISGIQTLAGVKSIASFEELTDHQYDFIMCNHLFEHLSYPLDILKRLDKIGDKDTYYYIEVPSESPFSPDKETLWFVLRRFYHTRVCRKSPFYPMGEHVNFYTPQSMRIMLERNGFTVLDIQENTEHNAGGIPVILSVLFVKNI